MASVQFGQHAPARRVILHLSDTHLLGGDRLLGERYDTAANLRRTLDAAEATGVRPDAVVFTGDLTDLGQPSEAGRLAEILRSATVPVVGVFGNHDHESEKVPEVKEILCRAGLNLLDGSSVEIGGVGFVGAKGFAGGFGRRMLGSFGEPAIKSFVAESVREAMALENAMRAVRSRKAVVVLHYAPIVETVHTPPELAVAYLSALLVASA